MNKKADKLYRVVITSVDVNTGEEEEELFEEYTGLTLLADNKDGVGFAEVIMHDNLMNMATKMCSGKRTKIATRLANTLLKINEDKMSDIEEVLLDAIGGLQ